MKLDAIADNYAAVMPMIREAIERRDDLALGYRSITEYVADRFGGSLQRLGVEVRREVVRELTEAGMSTRAVAPVVGISHTQVQRDIRASGGTHVPPESGRQTFTFDHGIDYSDHPQPQIDTRTTLDADTGEVISEEPIPAATITGLDGKTYTPRAPRSDPPIYRAPDPGPLPERPGINAWSRRVQAVTAECPISELSDDEVGELLGAATYLAEHCQSELNRRNNP